MKNKTISVLLTFVMILSVVPLGAVKARAANVGDTVTLLNCYGESIKYRVLSDTTLISGRTYQNVEVVANNYSGIVHIPGFTIDGSVVTAIGDSAFAGCRSLSGVTIPSSVTSIGANAFSGAGLTSLTIPKNVTSIGAEAFASSSINSVTIPDSITAIADRTFEGCAGLENITLPDSITAIGNEAFDTTGLMGLTIPKGVASIGTEAFAYCRNLASITIPDSVIAMGEEAFYECRHLAGVYFDGQPSIGVSAFDTGTSTAIYCHSGNTFNSADFSGHTLSTPSTHNVTVNPITNGMVTPSTRNGIPGETISFEVTPGTNYALKALTIAYPGATITGKTDLTMPDSDVTVSATFDTACTVTFDSNAGHIDDNGDPNHAFISASPMSEVAVSGGKAALPEDPETPGGKVFAGWNTAQDGSGSVFDASTTVNTNRTVYAQWKYPIYVSAGVGGNVSVNGNIVNENTSGLFLVPENGSLTISFTPKNGYVLSSFSSDYSLVQPQVEPSGYSYGYILVTAQHIVKVTFAKLYTITASAGTGGSISSDGATTVRSGSDLSYTITVTLRWTELPSAR